VNNNVFTNLMAADHLSYAATVFAEMQDHDRAMLEPLVERIGLEASEVQDWKEAAESIYVPFDQEVGIHPQSDGFFDLEPWDFAATPADNYPLLLHYHPLNIY
jgi:alpha,alpha-trehalose phosphorylase